MEYHTEEERAEEAEIDHHNMIVEYVGSDPLDSGGCLGVIAFAFTLGMVFYLIFRL